MGDLDSAVSLWRTQLSLAGRRALAIDWADQRRALRIGELARDAVVSLAEGGAEWRAFAAGVPTGVDAPTVLDPLIERSDEAFRQRGSHALHLIIGTVAVEGVAGEMPIATLPLVPSRRARRLPDIDIEPIGSLELCAATIDSLSRDYGLQPHLPITSVTELLAAIETLSTSPLPAGVEVSDTIGFAVLSSGAIDVERDLATFASLGDSTLLRALAGDPEARESVRKPGSVLDADLPVTVLPADSSQLEVIASAMSGATMIVEGPPGTGKSQTIANLVAAAVGDGRSVLFVAQKRAAVDVVLDRLGDAGLRDLVLDLHDDSARFNPPPIHEDDLLPAPLTKWPVVMPAMELTRQHAEAVRLLWERLPDLLERSADAVPDLGAELLQRSSQRVDEYTEALVAFGSARLQLANRGHLVDPAVLCELIGAESVLRSTLAAVTAVGSHPDLASARSASAAALRLLQLEGHIALSVQVPSSTTITNDNIRSLYGGSQADAGVRAAVVGAFLERAAALRQLGLVGEGQPASAYFAAARTLGVASLEQVPVGLLERVSAPSGSAVPFERRPLADVVRVLEDVLGSIAGLPSGVAGLIGELHLMGVLGRYADSPDPGSLFAAAVTEERARSMPLARSVDIGSERQRAAASVDVGRRVARLRVRNVAQERRASSRLDSRLTGELLAYEALIRRARAQRVANAEILRTASTAAMALYPVVVASPTAVARSVPQVADLYDMVIFDEASQIETSLAVSALSRARQAVVFGDSLQLPPDRFFQESGPVATDPVLSQASLLDAFGTLLTGTGRTSYLRWHYRSLDGRLVQFINRSPYLYNGRLLALPAPPSSSAAIELVRHSGEIADAVAAELRRVELAHSAAVVTLGVEMAEHLERLLQLPGHREDEPCVIRNVERFQGDERDHVIVVLPVAPPDGSVLQSLGPVNQAGGERRLNVALSRARARLVIVSTFGSSDLEGAVSPGAIVLRDFLKEIEQQGVSEAQAMGGPNDTDPVLKVIARRIEAAGLKAVSLGDAGADGVAIAVECRGGSWLAIDIDSPALCRLDPLDRELLRPAELERRGWRYLRTTVRDWAEQPDVVVRQIRELVEAGDA